MNAGTRRKRVHVVESVHPGGSLPGEHGALDSTWSPKKNKKVTKFRGLGGRLTRSRTLCRRVRCGIRKDPPGSKNPFAVHATGRSVPLRPGRSQDSDERERISKRQQARVPIARGDKTLDKRHQWGMDGPRGETHARWGSEAETGRSPLELTLKAGRTGCSMLSGGTRPRSTCGNQASGKSVSLEQGVIKKLWRRDRVVAHSGSWTLNSSPACGHSPHRADEVRKCIMR